MSETSPQGKYWCFTCNNYTEEDVKIARLLASETIYGVIGFEKGELNETPHLQGYLQFAQNHRRVNLSQRLPRASFFLRMGTAEQAADYCKKANEYEEWGRIPEDKRTKNGKREKKRWAEAFELAKAGNLEDIDPSIRFPFYRNCKEIRKDYMQKKEDQDEVCGVWIVGPSGVGKSTKARRDYPVFYYKLPNKWWDGYQDEDVVLIDDLDLSHDKLHWHLKIWADKFSFSAETKGGMINIRPKRIVVTSQYFIEDIFRDPNVREALKRRYKIVEMKSREVETTTEPSNRFDEEKQGLQENWDPYGSFYN